MTSFRGFPTCECLDEWLPVYEDELKRLGVIKHQLDVYQLVGDSPKSAGTHAGGAFDIGQYSYTALWVARQMGADATWYRSPAQGFDPHAHGVLRGCPHNDGGRYQIAAVDDGYNGLGPGGRGGRDDGPRPLSGRTWREGIAWARKRQQPPPTLLEDIMSSASERRAFAKEIAEEVWAYGIASTNDDKNKGKRYPASAHLAVTNGNVWAILRRLVGKVTGR